MEEGELLAHVIPDTERWKHFTIKGLLFKTMDKLWIHSHTAFTSVLVSHSILAWLPYSPSSCFIVLLLMLSPETPCDGWPCVGYRAAEILAEIWLLTYSCVWRSGGCLSNA